jgi:hypothetical protein
MGSLRPEHPGDSDAYLLGWAGLGWAWPGLAWLVMVAWNALHAQAAAITPLGSGTTAQHRTPGRRIWPRVAPGRISWCLAERKPPPTRVITSAASNFRGIQYHPTRIQGWQ